MSDRVLGMRGKYRWRTTLRENLPELLAARVPKGSEDCGDHEWYKADENTWRCYHCAVGLTHEVPWGEREIGARRHEAAAALVRANLRDPQVPHH